MKLRLQAAALVASFALGGCIHTNEMALAPNVVRLDTSASGLLFASQAGAQTQRRAAELTLQNGYTHYRLQDASTSQGHELVAVHSQEQGTVSAPFAGSADYRGSGLTTPIYTRTSNVGVTVVMYHVGEPGAEGAFDARQMLARYAQN